MNPQVIAYSIDYDGCGAEGAVQQEIASQFANDLLLYPSATFYFLVGSYRQTQYFDASAWNRNKNGSCFYFLKRFVELLKTHFVQDAGRIFLDGFLLQDISDAVDPGQSFLRFVQDIETKALTDSADPQDYYTLCRAPYYHHDLTKRDLIYGQIGHLYSRHSGSQSILLRFFDDLDSIMTELSAYFTSHSYLIPSTVALSLHQVSLEVIATRGGIYDRGAIQGCGRTLVPLARDELSKQAFDQHFLIRRYFEHSQLSLSGDPQQLIVQAINFFGKNISLIGDYILEHGWDLFMPFIHANAKSATYQSLLQAVFDKAFILAKEERVATLLSLGLYYQIKADTVNLLNYALGKAQTGDRTFYPLLCLLGQYAVSEEQQVDFETHIIKALLSRQFDAVSSMLQSYQGRFMLFVTEDEKYKNYSALHFAIHFSQSRLVKLMIQNNYYDFTANRGCPVSPWELVCHQSDLSIARCLLSSINDFVSAFRRALHHKRDDLCELLLEHLYEEASNLPPPKIIDNIKLVFVQHRKQEFRERLEAIVDDFQNNKLRRQLCSMFKKLRENRSVNERFYDEFRDIVRFAYQQSTLLQRIELYISKMGLVPVEKRFNYLFAVLFCELKSNTETNFLVLLFRQNFPSLETKCSSLPRKDYEWAKLLLSVSRKECVNLYIQKTDISIDKQRVLARIEDYLSFEVFLSDPHSQARDKAFHILVVGLLFHDEMNMDLINQWLSLPISDNHTVESVLVKEVQFSDLAKHSFFRSGLTKIGDLEFVRGLCAPQPEVAYKLGLDNSLSLI